MRRCLVNTGWSMGAAKIVPCEDVLSRMVPTVTSQREAETAGL
jgi:hypothetical protein